MRKLVYIILALFLVSGLQQGIAGGEDSGLKDIQKQIAQKLSTPKTFSITPSSFIGIKTDANTQFTNVLLQADNPLISKIERLFQQRHEKRSMEINPTPDALPVEIFFDLPPSPSKTRAIQNFLVKTYNAPARETVAYLPESYSFFGKNIRQPVNSNTLLIDNISENSFKLEVSYNSKASDILVNKLSGAHPQLVLEELAKRPEYAVQLNGFVPARTQPYAAFRETDKNTGIVKYTYYIIK